MWSCALAQYIGLSKAFILFGTKELVFCSMKILASKIVLSWVETKKNIGAKLNFDIAI